jgi:ubiquinone biosynthesis protein COQ4
MANINPASIDLSTRKDWLGAFRALQRLLTDANDTAQVFRIMRALNAGTAKAGYDRLLQTAEGGRIAYHRVELAELFASPTFIDQFAPGSVGDAYRNFLRQTGFTAKGLADISLSDDPSRRADHPYAWYDRRTRDVHDIWHILTGYRADDPLGEACLVAFSFAQTGGVGWAAIATGAMLKALRSPGGKHAARAIWEGYRNGRRATWLLGEDYERLFRESLDEARQRLGIAAPTLYLSVRTV